MARKTDFTTTDKRLEVLVFHVPVSTFPMYQALAFTKVSDFRARQGDPYYYSLSMNSFGAEPLFSKAVVPLGPLK